MAPTEDIGAAPAPHAIEAAVIYPVVAARYACVEHWAGQFSAVGDALGADCRVMRYNGGPDGRFPTYYEGDGSRNEDWYSWGEALLAPFDGVVDEVHLNPATNRPGAKGEGRASAIVFAREDGTRVFYGHVREIEVQPGDAVRAGQPVAKIGNNGYSWFPHVHVAAWRGEEPLQIRFDLRAMGHLHGRQ